MQHCTYLHIPKTAGTALKVLIKQGNRFFNVAGSHQKTLKDRYSVLVGVRDPWERFCSGFWEIKTLPLRHQLTLLADNTQYKMGTYEKLTQSYPKWYTAILSECETPDDFCALLKSNVQLHRKLYGFNTQQTYRTHTPLGIATQSINWWLGTVDEYKTLENRVVRAINIKSLQKFMGNYFNIEMPTDPFLARTREQFSIEQSYESSDNNLDWFVNQFRVDEYELIEYIKQRPYYYEK